MKKRKLINFIVGSIAVASTVSLLAVACSYDENKKPENINKAQPDEKNNQNLNQNDQKDSQKENDNSEIKKEVREYREVELPKVDDSIEYFKNIRMSLKEIKSSISVEDDMLQKYNNTKQEISYNVDIKIDHPTIKTKSIVINSNSLLTYIKSQNKLEFMTNLQLPQNVTIDNKQYSILEYKVNSFKIEEKKFELKEPIIFENQDIFVNLNHIFNINNKIYLEFDKSIKDYLFNIEAAINANRSNSFNDEKIKWEVVKRKNSSLENILEVSVNKEDVEKEVNFLEIFKIMLKKDDIYHLYLVDEKINSDLSKLRIKFNETQNKRTYKEVELPTPRIEKERLKSIRQTLREVNLSVDVNDKENFKNYSNYKSDVKVIFDVTLNDESKTISEIENQTNLLLTFNKRTNLLDIYGNINLPQQAELNNQNYLISEYKIKAFVINNQRIDLLSPVVGTTFLGFVNISDAFNLNKKIYLEFDGDIKDYEFYIQANANGDPSSIVDENKISWEVVRRKGFDNPTSILEISYNGEIDETLKFIELSKIMLKKDGHYHLYLAHEKIKTDMTKLRIVFKDINESNKEETPQRDYETVELENQVDETKRFKSIRQTLKEVNLEFEPKENQKTYSNQILDAKVSFELTLDDEQKTTQIVESDIKVKANYNNQNNKLEIYSNITLPQNVFKEKQNYLVKQYKVKTISFDNSNYELSEVISGDPFETSVNIKDVFVKDKKIYIEFDGDIKDHLFYIGANINGNKNNLLDENKINWKVVKRNEANATTSILEVSLNNELSDDVIYVELNKVMLKKDGHYHLYLFDKLIKSDLTKMRIILKDNVQLVSLPEIKTPEKRLKSAKQVITSLIDVVDKKDFNENFAQPTAKKVDIIFAFGDDLSTTKTATFKVDANLTTTNDQLLIQTAFPIPSTYDDGSGEKEVLNYFIKGFRYNEKEFLFANPKINNAKTTNEESPTILDSYIKDGKMYFEFDKNIKKMQFNASFSKGWNAFNKTNDKEVNYKVLTKEGSNIINSILEVSPSDSLKNEDIEYIRLLFLRISDNNKFYSYSFFGLNNPDELLNLSWK